MEQYLDSLVNLHFLPAEIINLLLLLAIIIAGILIKRLPKTSIPKKNSDIPVDLKNETLEQKVSDHKQVTSSSLKDGLIKSRSSFLSSIKNIFISKDNF